MHTVDPVCQPAPSVRPGQGIRGLAAVAAAVAIGAFGTGCGSGETFSASQFVDRINSEGVSIQLGRRLPSGANAKEVYAVSLPPLPGEPKPAPGAEGAPGASGSLYVYGDTGAADDQLKACRSSGGLFCFQASNIVVVLGDESSALEAQRLGVAIKRLAH
jgi:hypothetical protein